MYARKNMAYAKYLKETIMDLFQRIDNIVLLETEDHFELFRSISNAINSNDVRSFRHFINTSIYTVSKWRVE